MRAAAMFAVVFLAAMAGAQAAPDGSAIRGIIQEQVTAWNKGDAEAFSRHFAADGTFTNILGAFYTGHEEFVKRHNDIFKGIYRETVLQQDVVSLRFVRPEVAIVETLATVSGAKNLPPGAHADAQGRLRARLLQVLVKDGADWKIVAYHNVDVKPGVPTPEPK